jgi:hypothetical protein
MRACRTRSGVLAFGGTTDLVCIYATHVLPISAPTTMIRQCRHTLLEHAKRPITRGSDNFSHSAFWHSPIWPSDHIPRREVSHDIKPSSTLDVTNTAPATSNETAIPAKHKELLEAAGFGRLSIDEIHKQKNLQEWYRLGPPPLSEYRLMFGKHRGKLLEEVPDSYLVKYLVPRRNNCVPLGNCLIVKDAVEDFLKRHPEVKSQAGRGKTKPLEEGILKPRAKKRGRPAKKTVE